MTIRELFIAKCSYSRHIDNAQTLEKGKLTEYGPIYNKNVRGIQTSIFDI